jgi:hypothetical protein
MGGFGRATTRFEEGLVIRAVNSIDQQLKAYLPRYDVTYFGPLRIEIIIADDGDIESLLQRFLYKRTTFDLSSERKRALECQVNEIIR